VTTPSEYVDRHVRMRDGMGKLILMTYAANANAVGRSRMTQAEIAERVSRSERVVRSHMRGLLRGDPPFLAREGRTYVILGYAEHETAYCGHGECVIEAAGDELGARRRKQSAERARAYRQRRRQTG